MNLTDTWAQLDRQPRGLGRAVTRIRPASAFDLHVGLDLDTRRRQLIFTRVWTPADTLPEFPSMQSIGFRARVDPGGKRIDLILELVDPTLSDLFTPVVEDLVGRIVEASDQSAATEALADGLARWQDLLETLGTGGMGVLARRGLAGELIVLAEDLLPALNPDAAIAAWTGPMKANQDFQLPGAAVEVKVTAGKQPHGFLVANERELDPVGSGGLLLVHLAVDERRGGQGRSLNALVALIREQLAGHPVAASAFKDKLASVGYITVHEHLYDEPRYEVRDRTVFVVGPDFPRIVETDLRRGVGDVRYTVSLAACEPFAVDPATLRARIFPDGSRP